MKPFISFMQSNHIHIIQLISPFYIIVYNLKYTVKKLEWTQKTISQHLNTGNKFSSSLRKSDKDGYVHFTVN